MAIQAGIPATGTLLQVGNGASPEVFSTIANIGDINGPTTQTALVDVTSHTSTSIPFRQKIPTLIDPGMVSLPVFIIPASGGPSGGQIGHNYAAGIGRLLVNRGLSPGVPYNFKIIYPDGLSTFDEFQGYITKYSRKMPVAGAISGDLQIDITGIPSFA